MSTVEPWNVPRSGSVSSGHNQGFYEGFTYIQDVFGAGADRPTVEVPRFHGKAPTRHFTANTCRKCRRITIAGLWVGLRIDLEPQALTDLDEYHAIRDGIKTWNLYPDRTAEPRDAIAIRYRTITDRHARHTCGQTYGTQTPTSHQALNATIPDEPQF
jgi:hypothetical protein